MKVQMDPDRETVTVQETAAETVKAAEKETVTVQETAAETVQEKAVVPVAVRVRVDKAAVQAVTAGDLAQPRSISLIRPESVAQVIRRS